MIVGSYTRCTVGDRCVGLTDEHRIRHADQPYVIVREATLEEWLEQDGLYGITRKELMSHPSMRGEVFFYEISVD